MGNKRIKRIVLLSIAALFCLFIWRLNSPYKLTQFPYFCGLLYSIDKINIPESYLSSLDESNTNKKIINCTGAFYDRKNKKVKLNFEINGLNDSNAIDIFSLVVSNVSLYMKNNPDSYLNECKVILNIWIMCAYCFQVSNYKIIYSDIIHDLSINNPSYKLSYCTMNYPLSVKISSLKNYTWLEVIEFRDIFEVDDINSLDNLSNLKEIKCPQDMFSDEQKQKLIDKHKGLVFTSRG